MSPVNVEYFLNGQTQKTVKAEDGTTASMLVPEVGHVHARVADAEEEHPDLPMSMRLMYQFPDEKRMHVHDDSFPFNPWKAKKRAAEKHTVTESRDFQTINGAVKIRIKGY